MLIIYNIKVFTVFFNQINAALLSIEDFFQHKKTCWPQTCSV